MKTGTSDARFQSSPTYRWSAAPIGSNGWLDNSILWFRTRREARAYARSQSRTHQNWMIGRRVDATSRECAP